MADAPLTPFQQPINLQSLQDTFEMKLTEIEFETRFTNFFQDDLPPPLPKTVSTFVYPRNDKTSHKRRAPAPPKPKHSEKMNTYRLRNLQELGPILSQSATHPQRSPNLSFTLRVSMKSSTTKTTSKLRTISSTPSLSSVFKSNQTSSLKLKNRGTFRTAIKRKNKSSVDLLIHDNPLANKVSTSMPPCPRLNDRGEPEGEEAKSVKHETLQHLREDGYINYLSKDLGQSRKGHESVNSLLFKDEISNLSQSNSTSRIQLNHNLQKSCSSYMQESPSCVQGSPTRAQGSPTRVQGNPSRAQGSPSRVQESPSQAQGSPSRAQGSPSRAQGSPSRAQGSPSWAQGSPSWAQGSPSRSQGSPSRSQGSPSRSQGSPPHKHNGNPQKQAGLKQIQNSPSRMGDTPTLRQDSPDWMHSILSQLNGELKQKITPPSESINSPPMRLNCQSATTGYRKFTPNYVKIPCDHIYEEVEECLSNAKLQTNKHYFSQDFPQEKSPPPVPWNSPDTSPKSSLHTSCQYRTLNKDSLKKNPPPKPPRSRKMGIVELPSEGQSISSIYSRLSKQNTNSKNESINEPGSSNTKEDSPIKPTRTKDKITTGTDKDSEIVNAPHKLHAYYFGENLSKYTSEEPVEIVSSPKRLERYPNRPVLGVRPPGSRSFRTKTQKKTKLNRALTISKTFRFSLKTSLGNFKLTGKKCSKSPHEGPFKERENTRSDRRLSARSRQQSRSPTPRSLDNFRLPRVIIHCEPADEGDESSPEVPKPRKNLEKQRKSPSPVPSITVSDMCSKPVQNLDVLDSPDEYYTPRSSMHEEDQWDDDDDEVVYIGSLPKEDKSSTRRGHVQSPVKKDVMCISPLENKSPRSISSKDSSPRERDDEVTCLGSPSISSSYPNDNSFERSKGYSSSSPAKAQNLSSKPQVKTNPKYFRSYDDLLLLLKMD